MEIGAYMGECIQIIEFYGGDVVKVTISASISCFQVLQGSDEKTSDDASSVANEDYEATEKQKSMLMKRAIECGLQLLARLSHYRVYLTAEERSKYRTFNERENENFSPNIYDAMNPFEDGENNSVQTESISDTYPSNNEQNSAKEHNTFFNSSWVSKFVTKKNGNHKHKNNSRRASAVTEGSSANFDSSNSIDLELHMALSCGDVVNIVVGDIDQEEWNTPNCQHTSFQVYDEKDQPSNETIQCCGRLEYAIGGCTVEALDGALSVAKAGELSITPEAYEAVRHQGMNLSFERRRQFFVIKNIVDSVPAQKNIGFPSGPSFKHPTVPSHKKTSSLNSKTNTDYIKRLPGIRKQATKLSIDPLVPRVRNTSYMNLPADRNGFYYKYLNRSALYRMRNSINGNVPAQFRDVTIMFVSLGKTDVTNKKGLLKVQEIIIVIIKALFEYEGMLQQFAIDDKGATTLSVFGLPPLSHEREAVFAAKAALYIRDTLRSRGYDDFAISLSTGTIFTAILPHSSPYRRDASIAGDTIVIAVRMLKFSFSKQNVVCDQATKKQIGGLCEFEDLGENLVKGKVKPVQIYSIQEFTSPERDKRISLLSVEKSGGFIGYKSEMNKATTFIDSWFETPNHHILIVSGPSGSGKSFFCGKLHRIITSHDVLSCWSSSTEVEKGSKYYLLRNIMMTLLEVIDSEKIPHKSTLRTSSYSNSTFSSSNNSLHTPSQSYPLEGEENSRDSSSSSASASSNFIRSRDWFRRLASHTSMPHSSFVSPSNHVDNNNEMFDLIRRCLCKCGEEEGYIPLFKAIFTKLNDVDENRYTRLLDGRARDILLTGVITRMAHYSSKYVGIVFICDDVQWADSASLNILQHIHEHCQRIMLLMATRPVRDYDLTFLELYKNVGSCEEILLNGLSEDEIGEIILQNFDTGVRKVNKEIVKVVQKRTGGNPLYVKNMSIILKDFNHVTVVQGELVPSVSSFDLEDLLGNFDYKRIIKMQFDRLDPNYQEFLTIAACLDQFFTIYEIGSVAKQNNLIFQSKNKDEAQEHLTRLDVYNFLQKVDNGNSLENSADLYCFTHITIPQSIYDMVSYETRISLHRLLAKYYETQLSRDNHPQIIPKIARHYLQTDAISKQLYYLEALADQNMQNYSLPEATANLQMIVKILEQNNLGDQFGDMHMSDIYRRLGICFTMRTKLPEGERFLHKALDTLGNPWPKTQPRFVYKLWVNRFVQYYHRHFSYSNKNYETASQKDRVRRIIEIMENLFNIYYYTGNGRGCTYACLLGLNACEQLDDAGPNYSLFLARNALLFWLNDRKDYSIYYISKALKLMNNVKANTDTLSVCALLCFAAGKFTSARNLLYQVTEEAKTLGIVTDCQSFYMSVGLIVTMRIFEGSFSGSSVDMALLKQMADTAHTNGDYEAEIWLGVYNIGNALVMDRMVDCSPYVALLEAYTPEAASYNRIAIHGTLVCYYARNCVYDLAARHIQKLVNVLPSLTVTSNIFPIFGLIFATMGLYSMVEDGKIDLVADGDIKNYEKFILGLSRLNRAFQLVKFWEFTQPCLYLARALPYIATRRIVEGYMVLRHGIFEMHFIHEIKFLKAFYWANLGKFAFTPEDRISWTERAANDFGLLGIPADTYCNPDPENLHYCGFPADLRLPIAPVQDYTKDTESNEEQDNSGVASTSIEANKYVANDLA
ncbi:unnamed protein product [Rhizopus stolonifer]